MKRLKGEGRSQEANRGREEEEHEETRGGATLQGENQQKRKSHAVKSQLCIMYWLPNA